jgi:hypothetical protein
MYTVTPLVDTRNAVTVPLAPGFHGISLPVARLSAARWLRIAPPPAVPGARTRVKSPPMKILCAPTAIARTRPFVCHELAGVELTAPADAGHSAPSTAANATNPRTRLIGSQVPRARGRITPPLRLLANLPVRVRDGFAWRRCPCASVSHSAS